MNGGKKFMNLTKSIDFLLENAGPVIQYRLRKEILHDLDKTEEENLLEQIYQTPHFKLLQTYVKADGYIETGRTAGITGGARYSMRRLCRMGRLPQGCFLIMPFRKHTHLPPVL